MQRSFAMTATESTPLNRSTEKPSYVEFANVFRTRTARVRHFQCCVCAALLAIFMMALVISVSYSLKNAIDASNATIRDVDEPSAALKFTGIFATNEEEGGGEEEEKEKYGLTDEEWKIGVDAGREAIENRRIEDSVAIPIVSPSPNSRHRLAVGTSLFAGKLAVTALGEIAASRVIEKERQLAGKRSSFGSYFDGGWSTVVNCSEDRRSSLVCPIRKYRSYDGSCNQRRGGGTSFRPFRRVLPPDYADGIDSPRSGKNGKPLPSAREVSLRVHPPSPSSNPSFTVMLAVFGQFLDHDVTATALSQGSNGSSLACCSPANGEHPECFPVRVAAGDPVYDYTGSTCMEFVRSAPAPSCKIGPREQMNQVSAFIDGSMIYGPDETTARGLREGNGGRLKMQLTPDNRTLLPPSLDPNDGCNRVLETARGRYCFASGDVRANENLHLTTMHLIWARQHNLIANRLAPINPHWTDEILYQESRRLVVAQLQLITYEEFLPIILGESEMSRHRLRSLRYGYRDDSKANLDPTVANHFAAAAFRFAHTLLPGLMRITNAERGTTSYLELHRMLFNPYSLYAPGGLEESLFSATRNTIQRTSTHVTSQLTRHMFEDPLANATVPCGLDLVSLNIQRGRDHGLPGYPAWREYVGLVRPKKFSDLKGDLDPEALRRISELYASLDDVDLYTGALAEISRGDGLLGPTFTRLIIDQFVRLQRGDRYWYETNESPQRFNEDQLEEIRKTTLARVICDCSDHVTRIQPLVMRSIGPGNSVLSCDEIPSPSLDKWRELP